MVLHNSNRSHSNKTKHRLHLAPWVTSTTSHLIKKLETKHSEYSRTPSTFEERKIECLHAELSLHLEDDQYQNETSFFREGKFSKLQKYIKILNQANHLPTEIYLDDITAKSDVEKANMFNAYFLSALCLAANYHPKTEESTCTRLTEFYFNINEIYDALIKLEVTKAKGRDKISKLIRLHTKVTSFTLQSYSQQMSLSDKMENQRNCSNFQKRR